MTCPPQPGKGVARVQEIELRLRKVKIKEGREESRGGWGDVEGVGGSAWL